MLGNSTTAWGTGAKLLHWLGALLILGLLIHGLIMTNLPRELRFENYSWHAAIGYNVVALTLFRMLWRWLNVTPAEPGGLSAWHRRLAAVSHGALYVLMLAVALAGWALAGTLRRPLDAKLFGAVSIPVLPLQGNRTLHELLEETHEFLAYLLAMFVIGHIAAALYHHVVKKNDVLRRMSFGRS